MRIPGFVGGTYQAQSPIVGADEAWNIYAEVEQVSGMPEPRMAMYRDPGLLVFTSAGLGPIRGIYRLDGRCWFVSREELYEVFADGSVLGRGSVAMGSGPVEFASNGTGGNQLAVLSSGFLYVLSLTTNILTTVGSDLADYQGRIASIGFFDGYGLAHIQDTALFFMSTLEDYTTWDATDVFQKSKTNDLVRKMVISPNQAWLFGSETIEPWYNSGDADTPFQPIPDVTITQGILSLDAWTQIDDTTFWAGETRDGGRKVYRAAGFSRQRISTDPVETALENYGTIADCTVWDYEHRGHACIQFDFPSEGASWVYDTKTSLWHKRGYWDANAGQYQAHIGRNHVYVFGKQLVGSRVDGTVYQQTASAYSDAGNPQRWVRRAPALKQEMRDAVHGRFWVDAEMGSTPITSGQGEHPQMMMRYSDTSVRTWSRERWRSMGRQGHYDHPLVWNSLGQARGPQGRVYEISGTDPVPIALRDAGVDLGRRAA